MPRELKPINSDYLSTVLENITDILMLFTVERTPKLQYRVVYMNDAGYTNLMIRKDAVGLLLTDVIRPLYSATIMNHYDEVVRTGEVYSWSKQYENTGPQSRTLSLRTKLIPIKNALGDVIQVLSISNDETVNVSLQNAIEQIELQANAYAEATGQLIIITDSHFKVMAAAPELSCALSVQTGDSLKKNPLFTTILADDNMQGEITNKDKTYSIDIKFAPSSETYVCICKLI
jgi:hypothetical protein